MLYHVHSLGPMRPYDLEAESDYGAVLALLALVGHGRDQQGQIVGPTGAVVRAEGSRVMQCYRIRYPDGASEPQIEFSFERDWVPPREYASPSPSVRTGACDGRCHCPCHNR